MPRAVNLPPVTNGTDNHSLRLFVILVEDTPISHPELADMPEIARETDREDKLDVLAEPPNLGQYTLGNRPVQRRQVRYCLRGELNTGQEVTI